MDLLKISVDVFYVDGNSNYLYGSNFVYVVNILNGKIV